MTTVQDRYDEFQHIIDDQKQEIEVLIKEKQAAEKQSQKQIDSLTAEKNRLKELLKANNIAF